MTSGLSRLTITLAAATALLSLAAAPVARAQVLPATGVTIAADRPSPQLPGTPVVFTAAGVGSSGYQYQFYYTANGGTTWNLAQDWSVASTWTLPATFAAGTYRIAVHVSTNPVAGFNAQAGIDFSLTAVPLATGVTITADRPSPQLPGTPVVFTAAGVGSSGYQYRFFYTANGGAIWTLVQDWSVASSWTLPATFAAGTYRIAVHVRTAASVVFDAQAGIDFVLSTVPLATGVTITADRASPQLAGTPVVFTAAGVGSSGYQYRFFYTANGGATWTLVQDWSVVSTWTMPGTLAAGAYRIAVHVRTASSVGFDAQAGFNFTLSPVPPPAITSVTPPTGSSSGGDSVVIAGGNFQTGAAVSFGGLFTATVVSVGPTAIAVKAPAHPIGVVDVTVANPDNQFAIAAAAFTYVPPSLVSVTPASGPPAGGTPVALAGTGFAPGATVTVGGVTAPVTAVTPTSISATTPPGVVGAVDVVVTNPDALKSTLIGGFTYALAALPPLVTALTPTSGFNVGGTSVTITGKDFVTPTVSFGGVFATLTAVSATSITATTPAHAVGPVDVVVTNADGQKATVAAGFTYVQVPTLPPPLLTGLTPASGSVNGGTAVTLSGSGFVAGSTVAFGGAAAVVGAVTATSIAVTTPAGVAGTVDVTVTNPDRQASTRLAAYTYVAPPPVVLALSIHGSPQAGGQKVVLAGSGLGNAVSVTLGGAPATGLTFDPATGSLTLITPPSPLGPTADVFVPMVVTNVDGQSTTVPSFHYGPPPVATGFTPSTGPRGAPVTITGANFTADATGPRAGLQVSFGGVVATVSSKTATQIVVAVPKLNPGVYQVFVTNFDGQFTVSPGTFTAPGP